MPVRLMKHSEVGAAKICIFCCCFFLHDFVGIIKNKEMNKSCLIPLMIIF